MEVKSLRVRTKDVSEKRRLESIEENEKVAAKMLPSKSFREAAALEIEVLVGEYIGDLQSRRTGSKYCDNTRRQIMTPATDSGWKYLSDVTSSSFLKWRAANGSKSPRTLNLYLDSLRSFFNWLIETERTDQNPLTKISKIKTTKDKRRNRRALTDDELRKLLSVAPDWRRDVYLMAVYTGLRRDELKKLTWGDVHLNVDPPIIIPRAETTKNGKSEPIAIHPELYTALNRLHGRGKAAGDRVV